VAGELGVGDEVLPAVHHEVIAAADPSEMEIEQGLVALREERGVSQTALARMIGVSQPAIAKLESGRTRNVELKTLVSSGLTGLDRKRAVVRW
jgi:DNA-binding XRE family transcriptional regulator